MVVHEHTLESLYDNEIRNENTCKNDHKTITQILKTKTKTRIDLKKRTFVTFSNTGSLNLTLNSLKTLRNHNASGKSGQTQDSSMTTLRNRTVTRC